MTILFILAALIGIPVLASRGKLHRGAWVGIAVLCFIGALLFGGVSSQFMHEHNEDAAALSGHIIQVLIAACVGCFFAVCFYRKQAVK